MANSEEFEYESYESTATVQKYLTSLVEGFENGRITLHADDETIILNPDGLIQFRVKVEKKARSNKLNIRLQWKEGERTPSKSIQISS